MTFAVHVWLPSNVSVVTPVGEFGAVTSYITSPAPVPFVVAVHEFGELIVTLNGMYVAVVIAAPTDMGIVTELVAKEAVVGRAPEFPLGNVMLPFVVVTDTVAPVSAAQPVFCTLIVTTPPSPTSTIPSLSHVGVPSVSLSETNEALALLFVKSSTTPVSVVEVRAGPTAQGPAPRVAKPSWMSVTSAVTPPAIVAAMMPSRCSVIVGSNGAIFKPPTT